MTGWDTVYTYINYIMNSVRQSCKTTLTGQRSDGLLLLPKLCKCYNSLDTYTVTKMIIGITLQIVMLPNIRAIIRVNFSWINMWIHWFIWLALKKAWFFWRIVSLPLWYACWMQQLQGSVATALSPSSWSKLRHKIYSWPRRAWSRLPWVPWVSRGYPRGPSPSRVCTPEQFRYRKC